MGKKKNKHVVTKKGYSIGNIEDFYIDEVLNQVKERRKRLKKEKKR